MRRIENPLDCIADHHLAEREVCTFLDKLAGPDAKNVAPEDLADIIEFLAVELPLHLLDEEEDLFPRMQARCQPDDEIDRAIERLFAEHAYSGHDTEAVLEILRIMQELVGEIDDGAREVLSVYAGHARRHLIFENAVILPIARARLSKEDLEAMHRNMIRRRKTGAMGRFWNA